jgi:hypothetical protein
MTLRELRDRYSSLSEFYNAILEQIRILQREQPEMVYKPLKFDNEHVCYSYTEGDGCGGCIVGQALQRLGVTEFPGNVRFVVWCRNEDLPNDEFKNLAVISTIQERQDDGVKWCNL